MGRTSDARDRLLESAGTLIHERGYGAVGVAEICRRAEVQKGSFYHFFPSKQQLALELVEVYRAEALEVQERALSGSGSPLGRLGRYLEGVYARHAGQRSEAGTFAGCPLGNLALEVSTLDPALRAALRKSFEAQIERFARLLEEARGAGELPAGTCPREAAESLVAWLEGEVMLAKLGGDAEALRPLAPRGLRLLGVAPERFLPPQE